MKLFTAAIILAVSALTAPAHATQQLMASPSYHDFGQTYIGNRPSSLVNVQNIGNEDIPFVNVFTMGDRMNFDVMSFCGYLPKYSSCTIQVQYTPYSTGFHTIQLQIQGGISTAYVTESGTGIKR